MKTDLRSGLGTLAPNHTYSVDSHFPRNWNTTRRTPLLANFEVCIERKGCIEELAINLGQKKYAFLNEIERMAEFPHKFLVLEFNLSDLIDFPDNSRIPEKNKAKLKITGKYMLKCLMEFQLYQGIHILFCGNKRNGFLTVSSIFKRINELHTVGRKK